MTDLPVLNIAEVELRQACERLGMSSYDLGAWSDDAATFVGADCRFIKEYDDVLLTRPVPVANGACWEGGDAQPGCVATVLMFSTGARGIAQLECCGEPGGFAFAWEETSYLKLHRTTEEKWPR